MSPGDLTPVFEAGTCLSSEQRMPLEILWYDLTVLRGICRPLLNDQTIFELLRKHPYFCKWNANMQGEHVLIDWQRDLAQAKEITALHMKVASDKRRRISTNPSFCTLHRRAGLTDCRPYSKTTILAELTCRILRVACQPSRRI